MRTELSFSPLAQIETELLAVAAIDTQTAKGPDAKPQPVLLTSDEAVRAAAASVLSTGEYKAGTNETVLLHAPAGLKAKRLLIVGLGKKAKATVHAVRQCRRNRGAVYQAARHPHVDLRVAGELLRWSAPRSGVRTCRRRGRPGRRLRRRHLSQRTQRCQRTVVHPRCSRLRSVRYPGRLR